jgi:hypothetical protein
MGFDGAQIAVPEIPQVDPGVVDDAHDGLGALLLSGTRARDRQVTAVAARRAAGGPWPKTLRRSLNPSLSGHSHPARTVTSE